MASVVILFSEQELSEFKKFVHKEIKAHLESGVEFPGYEICIGAFAGCYDLSINIGDSKMMIDQILFDIRSS